jgi:hypothetical protein
MVQFDIDARPMARPSKIGNPFPYRITALHNLSFSGMHRKIAQGNSLSKNGQGNVTTSGHG